MSRLRVVIVGDVMLDVVVKRSVPLAATSDTPALVRMGRGGSGANIAVALAAVGHDVTYVGACGDDGPRTVFTNDLLANGVTARLEVTDQATGVVVALVDEAGQRAMLTDRGANRELSGSFLRDALDQPFDHLHVSGYTLLESTTRDAGSAALRFARNSGRSTSVDVCSVGPLANVTPLVFLAAATYSQTLFANEEEALVLSGCHVVADALASLAELFGEVVITRGPRGAVASCGDERAAASSQAIEVLDTTGAGDAATGAYLGARLDGGSLDEALAQAMAASALVVRGLGAGG